VKIIDTRFYYQRESRLAVMRLVEEEEEGAPWRERSNL